MTYVHFVITCVPNGCRSNRVTNKIMQICGCPKEETIFDLLTSEEAILSRDLSGQFQTEINFSDIFQDALCQYVFENISYS